MATVEARQDYGAVAKLLHWLMFGLIAAQFAIAWTMPDIGRDTRPEGLIAWHLGVGTVILLVICLRLLWRLGHPAPPPLAGIPRWQQRLAGLVHGLLYAVLLVLPPLGWGNASARGWDVKLFGLVRLPKLFADGSHLGHTLGDVHAALATVLLILLGLHVAAALYHQFIARDRTLQRMLPRFKARK